MCINLKAPYACELTHSNTNLVHSCYDSRLAYQHKMKPLSAHLLISVPPFFKEIIEFMIHLNAYIRHFFNCLLTQWPVGLFSDPSRYDLTPLQELSSESCHFFYTKLTAASQQPRGIAVVVAAFSVHIYDVISHACVATLAHNVLLQCGRRWGSTSLWRHCWKPAASNTTEQSVQTEKRVYSYTRTDSIRQEIDILVIANDVVFAVRRRRCRTFFLLLQLLVVELPMLLCMVRPTFEALLSYRYVLECMQLYLLSSVYAARFYDKASAKRGRRQWRRLRGVTGTARGTWA